MSYCTQTWQQNTWQGSTHDALQKMNTELRLIHSIAGSKQAWQKCKRLLVSDLVKLTASQDFIVRKQCLEHDNYMLQEYIMADQGMA